MFYFPLFPAANLLLPFSFASHSEGRGAPWIFQAAITAQRKMAAAPGSRLLLLPSLSIRRLSLSPLPTLLVPMSNYADEK